MQLQLLGLNASDVKLRRRRLRVTEKRREADS